MAYAGFHTSRIRRGIHVKYPAWTWNWDVMAENLVLNKVGANIGVDVEKEKARFRYKLFEEEAQLEIVGREKSTRRSTSFGFEHFAGPINVFERPDEYKYVFNSIIKTDTAAITGKWNLLLSNDWKRERGSVKSIFTILERNEYGIATNTVDSIFISPVSIQEAEGKNGQKGKLPFKMLGGYELSTADGVIAIIDLIGRNVWIYNELNKKERLIVAGITTALFARKVGGAQW
jgi:hypothetical protein